VFDWGWSNDLLLHDWCLDNGRLDNLGESLRVRHVRSVGGNRHLHLFLSSSLQRP
jgi:hypothetical protein